MRVHHGQLVSHAKAETKTGECFRLVSDVLVNMFFKCEMFFLEVLLRPSDPARSHILTAFLKSSTFFSLSVFLHREISSSPNLQTCN